jgi:hypothetical protein
MKKDILVIFIIGGVVALFEVALYNQFKMKKY